MAERQQNGIKKFKGNEYAIPIYTPRTTYNFIRQNDELLLNDLTLNFDPFTISILKNEFKSRNGAMNMTDFIMIIKDHLIHWQLDIPNREKKLIRCLSLLFNDIDLNGNAIMEWDEFTNYIIEKAAVLNTMKSKNDEIKTYHPCEARITKKFSQIVAKCVYIPYIDKIAFFEEGSDEIYFANPENGQLHNGPMGKSDSHSGGGGGQIQKNCLKVEVNPLLKRGDDKNPPVHNAKRAMLLDMIFIDDPKYNLLVTSSNDGVIRMFRYSSSGFVAADDSNQREHEIVYENAQIVIVWDYVNEILYSGQRDGIINIWDQKSEPQFRQLGGRINKGRRDFAVSTTNIQDKTEGHIQFITCMLPQPKLQFLASASFDRKIILWDTIENKKKREYKDYHKKGIAALDFNESLILLISGGYDHEIFIWNPYIDAPVSFLSGHASPIVSVKFVKNPQHIVSIDTDSTIKVWDVKKFKCLDSFSIENTDDKHSFMPQSLCIFPKPLKLIIPGKNIVMYEYDRNNNMTSADENVSICTRFVPSSLSLLTPVGSKVKLWNLLTGEVKKIFSNLTQSDISVLILDQIGKRFLQGDTDGFVGVFNVNNGALLKVLSKHKTEIISIIHAKSPSSSSNQTQDFLITCSIDNVIKIHDDKDLNESELIRTIPVEEMHITSIIYESWTSTLITGSNSGVLSLWEVSTGKNKGAFKDENVEEVAGICFLTNHSSLIYGTSLGKINLQALPPLVVKQTKLLTWKNKDFDNPEAAMCINSIYYCEVNKRIFIADEKFYIKCYDVSEVIDIIGQAQLNIKQKKRTDVNLSENNIKYVWHTRAHEDILRSMEYIEVENLIITTCVDKRVKIFSSIDGKYIESLKQQKETNIIRPIAYKKVESDEIYTPRMENRIDAEYMKMYRERKKLEEEQQKLQEQGILTDKVFDDKLYEIKKNDNKMRLEAFQEYEEQEFNPYYYFDNKVDKDSIEGKKSNDWRLYLDFDKYFKNFEDETSAVHNKVISREAEQAENPERPRDSTGKVNLEGVENLQEVRERVKKRVDFQERFKSTTAEQEEQLLQARLKREDEKKLKAKLLKSKNTKTSGHLTKKNLKCKKLTEENKVRLTKTESIMADRLANALEAYEANDPRNDKFRNYEIKKKQKRKNWSDEYKKVSR